jgi:hypothetical protein
MVVINKTQGIFLNFAYTIASQNPCVEIALDLTEKQIDDHIKWSEYVQQQMTKISRIPKQYFR